MAPGARSKFGVPMFEPEVFLKQVQLRTIKDNMQGRSEGVTIARGPHHYGGTESLRGAPNVPTMSQVLSSVQYICFRKTSGSNMGTPNLLLAPGAI